MSKETYIRKPASPSLDNIVRGLTSHTPDKMAIIKQGTADIIQNTINVQVRVEIRVRVFEKIVDLILGHLIDQSNQRI